MKNILITMAVLRVSLFEILRKYKNIIVHIYGMCINEMKHAIYYLDNTLIHSGF